MCTVLLPPGDNPIAVNKYIISYQMFVIKFIFFLQSVPVFDVPKFLTSIYYVYVSSDSLVLVS